MGFVRTTEAIVHENASSREVKLNFDGQELIGCTLTDNKLDQTVESVNCPDGKQRQVSPSTTNSYIGVVATMDERIEQITTETNILLDRSRIYSSACSYSGGWVYQLYIGIGQDAALATTVHCDAGPTAQSSCQNLSVIIWDDSPRSRSDGSTDVLFTQAQYYLSDPKGTRAPFFNLMNSFYARVQETMPTCNDNADAMKIDRKP